MFVSSENIDMRKIGKIRQGCPYMVIRFLATTQPILGQLDYNFFVGAQDTIIYDLSIGHKNQSLATFGGKIGVATTRSSNGLAPQNPTKKVSPLGGPFESTVISKACLNPLLITYMHDF